MVALGFRFSSTGALALAPICPLPASMVRFPVLKAVAPAAMTRLPVVFSQAKPVEM